MKKICPNCGREVDPEAEYCPFCHFNLVNNDKTMVTVDVGLLGRKRKSHFIKKKPKKAATKFAPKSKLKKTPKANPVPPAHASKIQPKKKMHLWSGIGALIVLVIAVLIMGSTSFYSRKSQLNRIEDSIRNGKVDHLVAADKQKITPQKLKPLSDYYRKNPRAYKKLKKNLLGKNDGSIRVIQAGHYLSIFPRYVVQLPTYQLTVKNPYQHTAVMVNDQHFKNGAKVLPGRYRIKAENIYLGQTTKSEKTIDLWSDKASQVKLNVGTFKIKSVANGKVYLNNKLVTQLDNRGQKTFDDVPLTHDFSLYVAKKKNGKLIKSRKITNAASKIKAKQNIVFNLPIGNSSVQSLLERNFNKPKATDFVGGKKNSSFTQIKKIVGAFKKSPNLTSYQAKARQDNKNLSSLRYHVIFECKFNMGGTSKQVIRFHNASVKKTHAGMKIVSIGIGKLKKVK